MFAGRRLPDGDYPNPEDPGAFEMATAQAHSTAGERPEIILATDPDCDRVGVAVWDRADKRYRALTGSQVGVLLADFLIECARASGQDLTACAIIKTIVSTEMATAVAAAAGVRVIDTLPGSVHREKIGEIEQSGGCFLLGFEESCGYLAGSFVRDKDAVIASALIACAARCNACGQEPARTPGRAVRSMATSRAPDIRADCCVCRGRRAMESLRRDVPDSVGGFPVVEVHDYLTGWTKRRGTGVRVPIDLPRENCIQLILTECGKVTLRPSGTEPKLKLYIAVRADSAEEASTRADAIESATQRLLPVAP